MFTKFELGIINHTTTKIITFILSIFMEKSPLWMWHRITRHTIAPYWKLSKPPFTIFSSKFGTNPGFYLHLCYNLSLLHVDPANTTIIYYLGEWLVTFYLTWSDNETFCKQAQLSQQANDFCAGNCISLLCNHSWQSKFQIETIRLSTPRSGDVFMRQRTNEPSAN